MYTTFLESGNFVSDFFRDFWTDAITEMKCMEGISDVDSKVFYHKKRGQRSEAIDVRSYSLQPLWEKYYIS